MRSLGKVSMSLPINASAAPSPSRDFGRHQRMAASKRVLLLLVAALLLHVAVALRISAFNIKQFGEAKMEKKEVADIIVEILKKYDISVVQEVRDSRLVAVNKLMAELNSGPTALYSYISSDPLGWTTYKERYLFIYRSDKVSVLDSYQILNQSAFSRGPFIVKFSSQTTQVKEFVMVPLHSKPADAVKEIDALYDVYTDLTENSNNDVLFLGDFNAGCSYVKDADWPKIRLRTNVSCDWLITDNDDTTVTATSHCPYDRIVACGTVLRQNITPNSAKIYNFELAFGLTNKKALEVSDHFPVEVTLKP
ncbi:deoxyribonuclease-1-like [Cuculus canorus]|uniref:deoxyribonuclease-1-like n=1 Tax=Cuculus canorus TaxID=55661 RepID=UPI0023AAC928|nr:deoxyribonuclease-1-like [Cuculus canorus]